jgi:hypothetical protein
MVYCRKTKKQIIGGAYNEIIMNDKIREDKDKTKNLTILNFPTSKNDTDEKLKRFVNFKFK